MPPCTRMTAGAQEATEFNSLLLLSQRQQKKSTSKAQGTLKDVKNNSESAV